MIRWIYSAVIEPNLLYGVFFWWTALDKQCNVGLLGKVRRFAAIYITGALRTSTTKALFAMLNWLPIVVLAMQAAKITAIRLNVLSRWHFDVYTDGSKFFNGVESGIYCGKLDLKFLFVCRTTVA